MTKKAAYDEAIKTGLYEKPSGLIGKYDNVRLYWEDEVLRIFLSPYLEELVEIRKGGKLRIFDLGCGSGDGFKLLIGIKKKSLNTSEQAINIINPQMLELYKGIDINPGLIKQARGLYQDSNMTFIEGDFNQYEFRNEEPFDIYFASYGTLSHNEDNQTIELLANIANHSKNGSLIICDWLGRYSYEWQMLWAKDLKQNRWMDYVISYLYPDSKQKELSSFALRLMSREEVLSILEKTRKKVGLKIKLKELFDRSIFIGRHIDTAQYNPHCQPIRRAVNSLFEPNIQTNLEDLLIDYIPKEGFPEVNNFFEKLKTCWNMLVQYVMGLLQLLDSKENLSKLNFPEGTRYYTPLKEAMQGMKKVIKGVQGLEIGDLRANIVEPQLGYSLRELEMRLQEGRGCGHGIVTILETKK